MSFFEKHKEKLYEAMIALHRRHYFVAYPEHPGAYPEDENAKGKAAFENQLGKPFTELLQTADAQTGSEVSPYTLQKNGVTYPSHDAAALVANAQAARKKWNDAGVEMRAGILMESLERMRSRFFEIAYATMHTTGQSFMMAFQASGPHAADRALEALAMAYADLIRFPKETDWEKPLGKVSVKLHKTYKPLGRGVGLVIGCSTFPTWNSLPGIFANLACGNPVIVKPHPGAVLPIAIVIAEMQRVLQEAGFDACTIQLAADSPELPLTKKLAEHAAVKLIDYTGGSTFGRYIETLPDKIVFTEKAGVNSVIIDSAENLEPVLQNLAFSVCLYSGQMCTAPQNFFIPAFVKEGDELISFDAVADRFKKQIEALVNNPKMGAGTLASLQNENTLQRLHRSKQLGKTIMEAHAVEQPGFPMAMTCSPTVLVAEAKDSAIFEGELFGPIIVLIKTKDTNESVALAKNMALKHGAITCAAYTTNATTEAFIISEMEDAFVQVSVNLTGFIWVNQHAAFSDLHVSGGNPAGNACFANPDFVNRRFVWLSHRKLVTV